MGVQQNKRDGGACPAHPRLHLGHCGHLRGALLRLLRPHLRLPVIEMAARVVIRPMCSFHVFPEGPGKGGNLESCREDGVALAGVWPPSEAPCGLVQIIPWFENSVPGVMNLGVITINTFMSMFCYMQCVMTDAGRYSIPTPPDPRSSPFAFAPTPRRLRPCPLLPLLDAKEISAFRRSLARATASPHPPFSDHGPPRYLSCPYGGQSPLPWPPPLQRHRIPLLR